MSFFPGDFLLVKNVGDEPVELAWNSRITTVEPGQEKPVRSEAVVLAAGDPRAVAVMQSLKLDADTVVFIPDRPSEVRRLRQLYGQYAGDERVIDQDLVPQLEVHSDDGEELYTVLNDPEGTQSAPKSDTSTTTSQELLALIERQQRQINLLKDQAGLAPDEATTEADLPDDDSDEASPAPKSRPRSKKETVNPDLPIKDPFDGS